MQQKEINLSDIVKNSQAEAANEPVHLDEMVKKDTKVVIDRKIPKKPILTPLQRNIFIAVIAIIVTLSIPTYLIIEAFSGAPKPPSQIITNYKNYYESASVYSTLQDQKVFGVKLALTDPSAPRTNTSPINGILLTDAEKDRLMNRLPVTIMVNNHAAARPQSNLSKADIVYETLAESGITRYMALYWSNDVNKVGPIRSARQYYLEWLSPFDAVFLHDGYASSEDDLRVDAGGNMYRYGTKTLSTYGAWREFDGVRVAPHNEYTSPLKAWDRAKVLGWTDFPTALSAWKFKKDEVAENRGSVDKASVVFHSTINNGGLYNVRWEYDKTTNSYLRWVGGKADIDQDYASQVSVKVVVIQQVKMTPTYNEKAHIIIETIGQGEAFILQDGKKVIGTWKKNSRTDRTVFYDADGKEMVFNRGLIWIQAVPKDVGSATITES